MIANQKIARTLYKKLLGLYPRAFREQLGESMEQTFDDLSNERNQQSERGLLGFVLWMFVETAIGIIQEYIIVIKETSSMNNSFTNLRLSAGIGFLLILPFLLLEFVFAVAPWLNTFSQRNLLDLIVVFGFLWLAIAAIIYILMPLVRSLRTRSTVAAVAEQRNATNLLTNPRSAALIGCVLALPFVTILALLVLRIEPSFGPLAPLLNNPDPDQPNVLGSLIILGAFVLSILGAIIARRPIVQAIQSGQNLFAHPLNLVFAAGILVLVTAVVAGIIVDQFPCWMGVPNCD